MRDGREPVPGGWNRFVIEVEDLAAAVARMTAAGVAFRSAVVIGPGGTPDHRRRSRRQPDRALRAAPMTPARPLMILVAGPYRSGTDGDPARIAANVEAMTAVSLEL